MRERRQAAGAETITALLEAPAGAPIPDAGLCGALVQPFLTPDGQGRFTSLLDLLRQGASSAGAVRVAYGVTPQAW